MITLAFCLIALRDAPQGDRSAYFASGKTGDFATPAPPSGSVYINQATAEELTQLPGIGESLARAILEERELHGPFRLAEDVMATKGIGPAKLAQIRPWLNLKMEGEE